jgi:hypothetical protein
MDYQGLPLNPAGRATLADIGTYYGIGSQAVRKWITRGLRGVKLEALRVGRGYQVRPADLLAFFAATDPAQSAADVPVKPQRQRHERHELDEATKARLRARGHKI